MGLNVKKVLDSSAVEQESVWKGLLRRSLLLALCLLALKQLVSLLDNFCEGLLEDFAGGFRKADFLPHGQVLVHDGVKETLLCRDELMNVFANVQ